MPTTVAADVAARIPCSSSQRAPRNAPQPATDRATRRNAALRTDQRRFEQQAVITVSLTVHAAMRRPLLASSSVAGSSEQI